MRTLLREPTVLWDSLSAPPPAVRSSPTTLDVLRVQPPAPAPTVPYAPPSGLLIDAWKLFRRLIVWFVTPSKRRYYVRRPQTTSAPSASGRLQIPRGSQPRLPAC
jgi:hypothetical protein